MKVAVLITGQPRFFEQGAWWLRNKVFPEKSIPFEVEYYCQFWDDGSPDLQYKVANAYNTNFVTIDDYDFLITDFSNYVREQNTTKYTDWSHVPMFVQENCLFNTPEITQYGKNFHGQYLSAGLATDVYEEQLSSADIVIRTRSDCIIKNIDIHHWQRLFSNLYRNKMFRRMMFASWLYIRAGIPHMGDFAFVSAGDTWMQYGKSIIPALKQICTKDKHWFKEVSEEYDAMIAHWMWNRISVYSKNDWLSFQQVWPTPYDTTLVRDKDFVYNKSWQQIADRYWTHKHQ